MTPRLIVLTLAFALVATFTFAGAAGEEEGAAAEREMVMDPSTGEMISAPEYGGTFTYDIIPQDLVILARFFSGSGLL